MIRLCMLRARARGVSAVVCVGAPLRARLTHEITHLDRRAVGLCIYIIYNIYYQYVLISIKILIMKIIMKLNKQMSFLYMIYIYMIMCVGVPLRARTVLEMVHLDGRAGWRARELRALSEVLLRASFVCKGIP